MGMTFPAAFSIASATLGVAVALLSWRIARAPGWQQMNRFALISLTAGLYCLCESTTTLDLPTEIVVWASRIGMFVGAFHGPSWLLYIAAQEKRPAKMWEKSFLGIGAFVAIISAIPVGIVTDRVTYRHVAWLGATYADVEATAFGAVVYGVYAVDANKGSGRVEARVYRKRSAVFIDVTDDGAGIAPSDVDHVFEPFFTTKRPGHGTGLGLAVSLGLARAQGGDIEVAETSPEGTTMRVRLAAADEDAKKTRK